MERGTSGASGVDSGRRTFLSLVGATALAGLAGCITRGQPSELRGSFVIDGSNTVFPHGSAIAEEFMWRNNRVIISARGSGTGAGFQRFCTRETQFQNASRAILPDEEARCEQRSVEWVELEALLDGIAIWVHPTNDWCDCLTTQQLREIWQRGSTVRQWSDIDPTWPDRSIDLYGRDSASGTFDYFTNAINGEYGNIRRDYSGTPDTNQIVRGVSGNRFAMGFGGAGYYYENEDDLKLVGVDAGDGCVIPTRETIEDGSYRPLSRPMFVYVRKDALARQVIRAFARFYFQEVDEEGYRQADRAGIRDPDERLTWTQWAARRVGFYAIDDDRLGEGEAALEAAIDEVIG